MGPERGNPEFFISVATPDDQLISLTEKFQVIERNPSSIEVHGIGDSIQRGACRVQQTFGSAPEFAGTDMAPGARSDLWPY